MLGPGEPDREKPCVFTLKALGRVWEELSLGKIHILRRPVWQWYVVCGGKM